MINLQFQRSHASITNFPSADIPDFTLITGLNGVGKTHLLQAIQSGAIQAVLAPNQDGVPPDEMRIFDWNTMVPQDTGLFASEHMRNERQNLLNAYSNSRNNQGWLEPARNVVRQHGLGPEYITEPSHLLQMPIQDIEALLGDKVRAGAFISQLKNTIDHFEQNILGHIDVQMRPQLKAVSAFAKKSIIALTENDILSPSVPSWGQINIFQQSFARLFVAYRDLLLRNTLAAFRASKGEAASFLTRDEFVAAHGPAPWDFVNSSLLEAGLDFSINSPILDDYTSFQPKLIKRSTGVEILFGSLSSGEKILMSFAFCVYYSTDRRQLASQPRILLLDEVDAPLHPSMSKNIINTITKTLVDSFGIKVIATTHSPSTVALAPENSIYTMRMNEPGLHKSTKAYALNLLTVGVPTIAISYDGRRQVFVESPTDAKIYDALYKLLKAEISSERSLEFIATGTRNSGSGDQNTGCDVVKRLVTALSNAGNISVFGLLDWDGKHEPTARIAVLAHGARNGLENVILDPLLLGITICRGFPLQKALLSLPEDLSYIEWARSDAPILQKLADAVSKKIFGDRATAISSAKYEGGLELQIDTRCFSTDDHQFEAMILCAFPYLKAIAKGRPGALMDHVIGNVLSDCPHFMPTTIRAVIEDLLNRSPHV